MPAQAHEISAKDFRIPLLLALNKASGGVALKPVQMEDCYPPILDSAGLDSIDQYGHQGEGKRTWVEHWIGRAFVALKKEGLGHSSRRGHWSLTEKGIEAALKEVGYRKAPPPVEEEEENTGILDIDDYLFETLVSSTECFGYFSRGSKVCSGCLLKANCKVCVNNTLKRMAEEIKEEERQEAEVKAAEAKAARAAADAAEMERKILVMGHTMHNSSGYCAHCGEQFEEEEKAVWVRGQGEYHAHCFLEIRESS